METVKINVLAWLFCIHSINRNQGEHSPPTHTHYSLPWPILHYNILHRLEWALYLPPQTSRVSSIPCLWTSVHYQQLYMPLLCVTEYLSLCYAGEHKETWFTTLSKVGHCITSESTPPLILYLGMYDMHSSPALCTQSHSSLVLTMQWLHWSWHDSPGSTSYYHAEEPWEFE